MKIFMVRSWESFKIFDPALIAGVHNILSRWKKHSLFLYKGVTQTWIYKSGKRILIKIFRRVVYLTVIGKLCVTLSSRIKRESILFSTRKMILNLSIHELFGFISKLQFFCIQYIMCITQNLIIIFPSKLEVVAFEYFLEIFNSQVFVSLFIFTFN